jgi:hypothetical protein
MLSRVLLLSALIAGASSAVAQTPAAAPAIATTVIPSAILEPPGPAPEHIPGYRWDGTQYVVDPSTAPVPPVLPGLVLDTARGWDGAWHYLPEPVAVRYAYRGNPDADLYDRDGLPASPFRSDAW